MAHQIGAVVLAAGLSSRMGQFKLLLPWVDGIPIVAHVVEKLSQHPLEPIIVVTGHQAEEVRRVLAPYRVTLIHNHDYAEGELLSSLQVGLGAMPNEVEGALIVPGDTPRIPRKIIGEIITHFHPDKIIAPEYSKQQGHPVLMSRRFWDEVFALPPVSSPRQVLRAQSEHLHLITVSDDGILADVDTPEAYEHELLRAQENNNTT